MIQVTPGRVIVEPGQPATYTVIVTAQGGAITGEIALECVDVSGVVSITCAFNPPLVITGDGTVNSTLTVTPGAIAFLAPPGPQPSTPLYAVWLGMPFVAFFGMRSFGGRRRALAVAMLTLLVLSLMPLAGCGNREVEAEPPAITTFRVQGTLGDAVLFSLGFSSIEVQQ
jgi:hypothetical protein